MSIHALASFHKSGITLFLLVYISKLCFSKPSEFLLDHECKTSEDFGWDWERYTESMPQSLDVITTAETIEVKDSIKLYLARNPLMYKSDQEYLCKIAFIVNSKDTRLLLTWKNFNVGSTRQGKDWFHVLDYDSSLDLSGPLWGVQGQALNGLRPPTTGDYHSIGQGFTLMYKGHPHDDSIVVILTAFKNTESNGECRAGDYLCTGQYPICISESVRCDGEDNCGVSNLSDERRGCYSKGTTISVEESPAAGTPVGLIGALTGIAITIVIVSVVGISIRTVKKRRRQQPVMSVAELSMVNTGYSRVHAENDYTALPQKPMTGASPGSQQRWNRNNFAYPHETIPTSNNRLSLIENNRNSAIETSSRQYATIDGRRPLSMLGANGYSESASNHANLVNGSLGKANGRIHTENSPYASTDIVHSIPDSATGATAAATANGIGRKPDAEYLNTMTKGSKGEPEYLNTLDKNAKEPKPIDPRSECANSPSPQLDGQIYYDLDDICNEYATVK